jgi:hypothetical protein
MKLAKGKVSFLIKLAAFQASGRVDTWHLKPCVPENMLSDKTR